MRSNVDTPGARVRMRARRRRTASQFLAVLAGLLLTAWPLALAETWQGHEETRDGITHVMNPATPSQGAREIELRELWRLGDPQDEEAELFGIVSSAFEDEQGHICLLDSQLSELRVYGRDGNLLRTMGRPGEGPGEFQNASDACVLLDGRKAVAQTFPGKLILFNADGTPAGELALRLTDEPTSQGFTVLLEVRAVGQLLGLSCINQLFGQQGFSQEFILGTADSTGRLQTRIVESRLEQDLNQGYRFLEVETTRFTRRWAASPDGTFYTPVAFHGYAIHVFDRTGQLQMVIEREYESVPRTAAERQRVEDMFAGFARAAPNAQVFVEDVHSDIEGIYWRPDGHIWVLTSAGRWRVPAGVLGVYDVFDARGRFVEQVTLLGSGDPREDGVYLLRDRVIVVGNFMGAVTAAVGGGETSPSDESIEDEGVTVTCYEM